MSISLEFNAQLRDSRGKAESRRMRRLENNIPAVIYGLKKDSVSITLDHKVILHALEQEEFYSQVLTVNIDGKKEKVILKALQRHPYKLQIMHMDFLRISSKEKLTVSVPFHLLGEEECAGLKEGGVLSLSKPEVEITCLPANLPTHIDIDISALEIGQAIHLSQVTIPEGVELANAIEDDEHDHAVVSVYMPREEVEEEIVEETEGEEGEAAEEGADEKTDDDASDKADDKDKE